MTEFSPDGTLKYFGFRKDEENLFLSVITIGEIQKGISKLPADEHKKTKQLQSWLNNELQERFRNRILEITVETAHVWGEVLGNCEKRGLTLSAIDSLIASQGIFHKMIIVTRNISDMESSGVSLFNPRST